jgi:CubicO group peptidase (beta-lactamase class C family)
MRTPFRAIATRICTCICMLAPILANAAPCAAPTTQTDGWELSTPEAAGFNASALCASLTAIAQGKDNIHGIVIERHGKLVAELYRSGKDRSMARSLGFWPPLTPTVDFGPDTLHDARSIGKSVIDLLIGIEKQQGKIASLAKPVLDYYPEHKDLRSPALDAIHLEHLLTMSGGWKWDEAAQPNNESRLFWKSDPVRYVLEQPIEAAPGTVWNYNGGGTVILADIVTRVSGKPWLDVAKTELFAPLGITHWEWVTDLRGRPASFAGLRLRPRDMAKLGRLMLNHGRWNGRQVVTEEWVAESMRPRLSAGFKSPANQPDEIHYGYQWWAGTAAWKGRRIAWNAAFGNGGQRIFVVPELDLTVVVTAGDYGSTPMAAKVNQLLHTLIATVAE